MSAKCVMLLTLGCVLAKKQKLGDKPDYYPRVNPNPSNIEDLNVNDISMYFDMFKRFYELDHKNNKHLNKSFDTFTDNVKRIIIMNKFTMAAKFGINEFSHLTFEEFTNKYTGFNDTGIDDHNVTRFSYNSTQGAPINLDWRTHGLTRLVRHQGPCKSSYVFSAIENIEAQMAKNYKITTRLSEQQAYDCEPTGSCTYGGMPHKVMESIMEIGGIEEQINYIYDPKDQGKCRVNKKFFVAKVTKIQRITPVYENSLIALLALYGPIVTTMYISDSVKNYYRGVLWPNDCDGKANHAVLLVGYGVTGKTCQGAQGDSNWAVPGIVDSIPYWIIKNSWGMLWGESGYMRLIRGEHACNIGTYVVTATVEPIEKYNTTLQDTTSLDLLEFQKNVSAEIKVRTGTIDKNLTSEVMESEVSGNISESSIEDATTNRMTALYYRNELNITDVPDVMKVGSASSETSDSKEKVSGATQVERVEPDDSEDSTTEKVTKNESEKEITETEEKETIKYRKHENDSDSSSNSDNETDKSNNTEKRVGIILL